MMVDSAGSVWCARVSELGEEAEGHTQDLGFPLQHTTRYELRQQVHQRCQFLAGAHAKEPQLKQLRQLHLCVEANDLRFTQAGSCKVGQHLKARE